MTLIDTFARFCGTGQDLTNVTSAGAVSSAHLDMQAGVTPLGANTNTMRQLGGGQLVVASASTVLAFTSATADATLDLRIISLPKIPATVTTAMTLAAFNNTSDVAGTVITSTAHGLANGTRITVAQTTGTLNTGTGYAVATNLWIVNATTNTFGVSATRGGSAITLADQTGTTTVTWYPEVLVSRPAIALQDLALGRGKIEAVINPAIIRGHIHRYLMAQFIPSATLTAGTITVDLTGGFAMDGYPFNAVNYVTA